MEAIISFKFDNFLKADVSEKEITINATKAIETVNSEINKYLKETNSDIYGDEDLHILLFIKVVLKSKSKSNIMVDVSL